MATRLWPTRHCDLPDGATHWVLHVPPAHVKPALRLHLQDAYTYIYSTCDPRCSRRDEVAAMAAVRERLTTDQKTADQAQGALDMLGGSDHDGTLLAQTQGADAHPLPPELDGVLRTVLSVLARGGTVTITATPQEVTTTTAAGILGVSRPTVMKMIRDGDLPAHKAGTHHRILTSDVYAVLDARRARERTALEELLDLPE